MAHNCFWNAPPGHISAIVEATTLVQPSNQVSTKIGRLYMIVWSSNRFNDFELTLWGQDKMDTISQTIFSSTFSWMKMFEFRLKFH